MRSNASPRTREARSLLPLGLFVAFLWACGGSGSIPASPTSSAPRNDAPASSLTVAGPDVVMVGRTAKFDATAILTSGFTIYHLSGVWSTDNPDVATIDGIGVFIGHRVGAATITATYRGASASASVQVVPKPASKPFPASANMVISYDPDPVPGSLTPCGDRLTPAWRYSLVITETRGVGFTLEGYTWNLYDENGRQIYGGRDPEDDYFAPNSVFVEEVCTSLAGRPSGSSEDIMDGVDDNGNHLTFSSRLRFLPVSGASSFLSPILPNVMAPRSAVRTRQRVR
jgi:Bacterial Ig-like domain (group 2)